MESSALTTTAARTRKRILLVIDHLGSGGAQRQFSMLAILLHNEGYRVEVLTYYKQSFFLPVLRDLDIPVHCLQRNSKLSRLLAMRNFIRSHDPDVLIAYLNTPSLIAELAGLPMHDYALVVSERSLDSVTSTSLKTRLRLKLHGLSDRVISNSYAQAEVARSIAPGLSEKIVTIWNCVDLSKFIPHERRKVRDVLRAVCVGSYSPQKNPSLVADALRHLTQHGFAENFTVDWFGNPSQGMLKRVDKNLTLDRLRRVIKKEDLSEMFRLNSVREDIQNVYREFDVLLLTSKREGCPNVVCEAMACGLPVIASRVGDVDRLVRHEQNGFLFESGDAEGLAACLVRFHELSSKEKKAMGRNSRQFAVDHLSPKRFVQEYKQLIEALTGGKNGN